MRRNEEHNDITSILKGNHASGITFLEASPAIPFVSLHAAQGPCATQQCVTNYLYMVMFAPVLVVIFGASNVLSQVAAQ